jgi:hypothetical protein
MPDSINITEEQVLVNVTTEATDVTIQESVVQVIVQDGQGPQGPPGADGADSTVQGPQGPQGIQGIQGPAGADGKTVLNGTTVPGAGIGTDGDFYIRTDTDEIYGPKTAGAWGSPTSLVGPEGPAGGGGLTVPQLQAAAFIKL